MRVYLVEKICDYDEYGGTEVVKVFSNEKSAREYINKQPDAGSLFMLWDGRRVPIYYVTVFEVEE